MNTFPKVTLVLPNWIPDRVVPGQIFASIEDRMRLAISLAAENIERGTGGPFGAAVFESDSGAVVSVGVNIVEQSACSLAHAEAVALAVAQRALGTYNLGDAQFPRLELVTSAQPCIQCWGNVWWSGVRRLITGASVRETESITGFQEGPVPADWADRLRQRVPADRAVEVVERVLADESCAVLRRYREAGGVLY